MAKLLGLKNITGLITDDLDTYKSVSRKYQKPHQACLGHVKKNITKRLNKLAALKQTVPQEYLKILAKILDPPEQQNKAVLEDLLKDPKVWKKGKRNKHWVKLREIITDLLRNWDYYLAHLQQTNLPITNNKTEQGISRSKVRYKLTRGLNPKKVF